MAVGLNASVFLLSYVNTYLREEIQAEGFVRKFAPFRNFLKIAATASGTILQHVPYWHAKQELIRPLYRDISVF